MERQFIAERADWTLSAGESLVQQESLEHLANAFMAHNLQPACHCVRLALSVWHPTEACSDGPNLHRVCRTEHSFNVLINGLSTVMPLRPHINHGIQLSNGENVSTHTKHWITHYRGQGVLGNPSVWENTNTQTLAQASKHSPKAVRWAGNPVHCTCAQTNTKINTPQLMCWQAGNDLVSLSYV